MAFLPAPPPPQQKIDDEQSVNNVWHEWFLRLFGFTQATPTIAGTQASTGAAGTADALPTNPDTYIKVRLPGGAEYVVPAYKVN